MSKWEYALNSMAWLIGGYTLRLIIERIRLWWYLRREGVVPQVGAGTLVGTIFILLTVIQFLLIYSGRLHTDSIQRCQDSINRNNVAVANVRNDLQTTLNEKVNGVIKAKAVYDGQFQQLIIHPLKPDDKAGIKKATAQLSQALGAVLLSEKAETRAFHEARDYVQKHPAIPVTVCTGDPPAPEE